MALSKNSIDQFIEHGFTFVRGALPKKFIDQTWGPRRAFLNAVKGFDSDPHLYFPLIGPRWKVREVAPNLDSAVSQILGGEGRAPTPRKWGDGFVVAQPWSSLNQEGRENITRRCRWHKDGFHRHFLDSPEIGVIALVMWTNLTEENGATAIAENSIKIVADKLFNTPEGLDGDFFDNHELIDANWSFQTRATGEAGDVCLMHPMLLHAIRPNLSKDFRAATNPVVSLAEPMKFNRTDGHYSPVELAVLNALGVTSLDFLARGKREKTPSKISGKLDAMRADLCQQVAEFSLRSK